MATPDLFASPTDFNLLSLHDLLAARDNFHLHLINKANVVATAVGRYRIRSSDPWPTQDRPDGGDTLVRGQRPPRTLANSDVRSYSWPAISVRGGRPYVPAPFLLRAQSDLGQDSLLTCMRSDSSTKLRNRDIRSSVAIRVNRT